MVQKRTLITDEPFEKLEVVADEDTFSLVQKVLPRSEDGWKTKVIMLNKREELKVNQAITDHILNR